MAGERKGLAGMKPDAMLPPPAMMAAAWAILLVGLPLPVKAAPAPLEALDKPLPAGVAGGAGGVFSESLTA